MIKSSRSILLICLLSLFQTHCVFRSFTGTTTGPAAPADGYVTLGKIPFKEAWYGMYFQDDKVGYSHFKIDPSGENFAISSDSMMRLTTLKKTKEIVMKERVMVRPDLTMISFDSRVRMEGKNLKMVGAPRGDKFVVDINVDGETLTREFPLQNKLYHSCAISLMPALRGLREGNTYSFNVFNAEKQGIMPVEQMVSAVKGPTGPNGAVWRIRNSYGKSIINAWLDRRGLTVLEKALDGSLITMLEDRESAESFLKKKSRGKDLILDFSRIRVAKAIPNPEKVRFLKVRMRGIEPGLIAQDHRQRVRTEATDEKGSGFDVFVHAEDPSTYDRPAPRKDSWGSALASFSGRESLSDPVSDEYLAPTWSIQSDHKEIVEQARKIVSPRDKPLEKVTKLVGWTAQNIKNKMTDSFTALSVLRNREGECQSHSGLYVALARSQKIPTRQVTGIVYTREIGFLYHAWAESYIDRWIAVDPTLNQVPADATHIKITGGKHEDEVESLLKMVGKVKMEVLEFQ